MEDKEKEVIEEDFGLNMDFDETIDVPMRDNSPEAKQRALETLMNTKVNKRVDVQEFEQMIKIVIDILSI